LGVAPRAALVGIAERQDELLSHLTSIEERLAGLEDRAP